MTFYSGLTLGLAAGFLLGLLIGSLAVGAYLTQFVPRSSLHK